MKYVDDRHDFEPVMRYIGALVAAGEPFMLADAAQALGRTPDRLRDLVRALDKAGKLNLRSRGHHTGVRYQIMLDGGRATPWPVTAPPLAPRLLNHEIEQRRLQAIEQREQHRRHWLTRERSIFERPQPSDGAFMDKATLRALQGFA